MIGMASVAAGFPGFRKWSFACEHGISAVSKSVPEKTQYRPLFFSDQQYGLVSRIAEMIVPADDSPGAAEGGVPEFIDFMVATECQSLSGGTIVLHKKPLRQETRLKKALCQDWPGSTSQFF